MDTLPTFEGWNPSTSLPGSTRSNTRCSSMCWGSGSCTSMPWILGSPLRRSMTASSSASVACLGSRMVSWCRPASPQALPFMRTYTWEAGLSPTRTTASPGVTPRALSRSSSDASSARISRAIAVPSMSLALLGNVHRPRFADHHHLDLPRILHVLLDAAGDPLGQIGGRADVVQQAAAFGQLGVEPQLARHHPREPRHFLRVLQDVLSV